MKPFSPESQQTWCLCSKCRWTQRTRLLVAARLMGQVADPPMWSIIIGIGLIIAGISGAFVLRGTGSGLALAGLGGVLVLWGTVQVSRSDAWGSLTQKKYKYRREEDREADLFEWAAARGGATRLGGEVTRKAYLSTSYLGRSHLYVDLILSRNLAKQDHANDYLVEQFEHLVLPPASEEAITSPPALPAGIFHSSSATSRKAAADTTTRATGRLSIINSFDSMP